VTSSTETHPYLETTSASSLASQVRREDGSLLKYKTIVPTCGLSRMDHFTNCKTSIIFVTLHLHDLAVPKFCCY
jgi:hypothetical protein